MVSVHQVILAQAVRSYVTLEASFFASGASSGRVRCSMSGKTMAQIIAPCTCNNEGRVLCSQHLHRSKLEEMVDVLSSLDKEHDIVVGRRYFNCLSRIKLESCAHAAIGTEILLRL